MKCFFNFVHFVDWLPKFIRGSTKKHENMWKLTFLFTNSSVRTLTNCTMRTEIVECLISDWKSIEKSQKYRPSEKKNPTTM